MSVLKKSYFEAFIFDLYLIDFCVNSDAVKT